MTDKFQSYVDNIQEKNKFKLLLIPILVVTFIIVLNQLLIIPLIFIFNDSLKEVLSFTGTSNLVDEAFTLFLSIFLMTKISKLKTEQLGFSKDDMPIPYLKGALFGILQIFTVFFIIFGLKAIDVYYVGNIGILLLIKVFIIFIFQGLLEEILFRGYLMPFFSKVIGIKFTIILLSFLFTCIHLINPNLDIIGLANVFLAGVTFSLIYYYTGNLLLVGAMHTFWNFIIAFILGSPVSGMVTYNSILISAPVENKDLISGGLFGFEASIVTTIVELAIILFMIYLIRKEKNKFLGDTFMKKEIIYNKLIRDNILEIISNNNQKSSYHIATDEEYKNKLLEKLQEEVCEFTTDKNEEELADIFEVIEHIITAFNFNKEKILEIREKKAEKNGKFSKKIILEKVFNMEK